MVFKLCMMICLSAFYAAYLAKQLLLRRRGIRTNRLARGAKPRRTRVIEALLLAATYGAALVQFAGVFWGRYMGWMGLPAPVRAAGVAVATLGVAFFILASATMGDSWRAGVDQAQETAMVTRGVYRLSRNPAFVGFDLLYAGTFLIMPNAVMLAVGAAAMILLHLQILEEERHLSQAFGTAYLRYQKATPRYLLFI